MQKIKPSSFCSLAVETKAKTKYTDSSSSSVFSFDEMTKLSCYWRDHVCQRYVSFQITFLLPCLASCMFFSSWQCFFPYFFYISFSIFLLSFFSFLFLFWFIVVVVPLSFWLTVYSYVIYRVTSDYNLRISPKMNQAVHKKKFSLEKLLRE